MGDESEASIAVVVLCSTRGCAHAGQPIAQVIATTEAKVMCPACRAVTILSATVVQQAGADDGEPELV